MTGPTFRMDADGRHFWWAHECNFIDLVDSQTLRHDTMLPINDKGWQVVSTDPMTVTPSILCGSCGEHGFITEGKWVGC